MSNEASLSFPSTTRAWLPFSLGCRVDSPLRPPVRFSAAAPADIGAELNSAESWLYLFQAQPFLPAHCSPTRTSPTFRPCFATGPPPHPPPGTGQRASKAQHAPHFHPPGATLPSQIPRPFPSVKAPRKCLPLLEAFSDESRHPHPRTLLLLPLNSYSLSSVVLEGI